MIGSLFAATLPGHPERRRRPESRDLVSPRYDGRRLDSSTSLGMTWDGRADMPNRVARFPSLAHGRGEQGVRELLVLSSGVVNSDQPPEVALMDENPRARLYLPKVSNGP